MPEDKTDYDIETENNMQVFVDLVRRIRPDMYLLMQEMDRTKVNSTVIWKVIQHLSEIANGTKYGQVHVVIENGVVTFVRGEQADRVNEPAIIQS